MRHSFALLALCLAACAPPRPPLAQPFTEEAMADAVAPCLNSAHDPALNGPATGSLVGRAIAAAARDMESKCRLVAAQLMAANGPPPCIAYALVAADYGGQVAITPAGIRWSLSGDAMTAATRETECQAAIQALPAEGGFWPRWRAALSGPFKGGKTTAEQAAEAGAPTFAQVSVPMMPCMNPSDESDGALPTRSNIAAAKRQRLHLWANSCRDAAMALGKLQAAPACAHKMEAMANVADAMARVPTFPYRQAKEPANLQADSQACAEWMAGLSGEIDSAVLRRVSATSR